MENIQMEVKGNVLTLTIDLSKDFGPSTSGKTTIVASSNGNAAVPGHANIRFGLNVYKK